MQRPLQAIPNLIQRRLLDPNPLDLEVKLSTIYADAEETEAFKETARKLGYKVENLLKLMIEDRILH
ncbi:hypothetical protein [Ferribacterium limneticum]|uniref:hypothetical protein n=1 Tax=Ferribacterium limneticum TaxID=76259 RepID=UPI001CF88F36|nr:hypothetical protein [Ferribacterium limneticum]UCV26779.1 hypothetical protein KI617_10700 [Ferribacterium limneticum]UCV30696.1 hypothetical protein KI608_10700 [Ferribacterium limneticum]